MGCRYVTIYNYLTYFILPVRQASWHRPTFEYNKFKSMQWTNSARPFFYLSDKKENRVFQQKRCHDPNSQSFNDHLTKNVWESCNYFAACSFAGNVTSLWGSFKEDVCRNDVHADDDFKDISLPSV